MTGSPEADRSKMEQEPQPQRIVLQFAGQGVKPEDIINCADQLGQTDGNKLAANIAIAEKVSGLRVGAFLTELCRTPEIFQNNALAQLAIHTLNVTAGDIALSHLEQPDSRSSITAVIGHSLGEVAAMDIAGVFPSRQESMEFVFTRGKAMNEAHRRKPGNLYAIVDLGEEAVKELCLSLNTTIALENSPRGFVVAGEPNITDKLTAQATARGARNVIALGLPGFHTERYMSTAQAALRKWNEGRLYQTARFPVFSNFDARLATSGTALVNNHLNSVTSPVLWQATLAAVRQFAFGDNVIFLTLGPGGNLAAINRGNGIPPKQTMTLEQLRTSQA